MAEEYKDYYKILGVDKTASQKEIKTAYRKAARQHHPDLHTKGEKAAAEEKFKEINEAYTALGSEDKRAQYDGMVDDIKSGRSYRTAPGSGSGRPYTSPGGGGYAGYDGGGMDGGSFSDFFESMFGRGGFGAPGVGPARSASARGRDLESDLRLSIEEAYRGGLKTVQFSLRASCETCGGDGVLGQGLCPACQGTGSMTSQKTLEVQIPPFVREGSKIRLRGQGALGSGGADAGDLLLTVRLLPDALFAIKGSNLETSLTISPPQAVLGAKASVPTLEGEVRVTIPPMTKSGRKLRLKSKGWKSKEGIRGDLYIRVTIDIPQTLDEEQRSLYQRLAELWEGGGRAMRYEIEIYHRSRVSLYEHGWVLAEDLPYHPLLLQRLADVGAIEPRSGMLSQADTAKVEKILRLRRSLGVNLSGAVIIAELMDRLDDMEADIDRAGERGF